jgi:rfaE bifunctional protein nucleotidyltransferase chain/domain
LELGQLVGACREWRDQGDRLVTTNGCFDVLHAGHVRLLTTARDLGDRLVVGLNSDDSVRGLKGADRPLVPQAERAATLAALPFVDWVQIFSEPTPDSVLEAVRPAVHVKGGDYRAEELPEHDLIQRLGGEIVIVPELPGTHTSSLLQSYLDRRER